MIGIAGVVALVFLFASAILGAKGRTRIKGEPFECGVEPIGEPRRRFSVKFYMVALIFVLFDIEAVFLFPWAVNLGTLGWLAFVEMIIFIGVLAVGLVYVWRKGALQWD